MAIKQTEFQNGTSLRHLVMDINRIEETFSKFDFLARDIAVSKDHNHIQVDI